MAKRAPTSGMNPIPSLIRASAHDAGNQSMRAAGRTQWNDDDWNAMCATQDRLITACYGEGPRGRVRFGYADAMAKAGLLTIYTKDFYGVFEAAWAEYEASFAQAA